MKSSSTVRFCRTLLLAFIGLMAGCGEIAPPAGNPAAATPAQRPGRRGLAARPVHPDAFDRPRDASDRFFEAHPIVHLKLQLDETQTNQLREEPRKFVRATLLESDGETYTDVAVKLKGAAGSFQGFDDRPALTIHMSKFHDDQTFHRMEKFHLNNSVQDETYACEEICSELCQELSIPATRVAHARLWLNDRDLGLYVLKEGFDKQFLRRHFSQPNGNLYDGGFLQDIDADLERDSGDGPPDFSDLRGLSDACREADPQRRWALVSNSLDINAFIEFTAFELMTCHWDGYVRNRNNYRVYFDPGDGKARFLPHGMDQMFSDPGFSILEFPESMLGAVVMQNPEWRRQYRNVVAQVLPRYSAESLTAKLDAIRRRLSPTLAEMGPEVDQAHNERCQELRERLVARAASLREQVAQPDPSPLEFAADGQLAIADWEPRSESEDAQLEQVDTESGVVLTIEAGPSGTCVASWRRRVLLAQGRYRLSGEVRCQDVAAEPDEKGRGAGLRISGANREIGFVGNTDWTSVAFDFDVAEPARDVELVAELRGQKGRAVFRAPLALQRLAPPAVEPPAP